MEDHVLICRNSRVIGQGHTGRGFFIVPRIGGRLVSGHLSRLRPKTTSARLSVVVEVGILSKGIMRRGVDLLNGAFVNANRESWLYLTGRKWSRQKVSQFGAHRCRSVASYYLVSNDVPVVVSAQK